MAESDPAAQGDLALLREAVARAFEAVNRSQTLAQKAHDPLVREYLLQAAREEKGQAVRGLALMAARDPELALSLREDTSPPSPEERRPAPAGPTPTPLAAMHEVAAPPSTTTGTLTVGSLRQR